VYSINQSQLEDKMAAEARAMQQIVETSEARNQELTFYKKKYNLLRVALWQVEDMLDGDDAPDIKKARKIAKEALKEADVGAASFSES
jgi:hypothetical protein